MTELAPAPMIQLTRRPHPLWRMMSALGAHYTRIMLLVDDWAGRPGIRPFAIVFIAVGWILTAGIYAASPWYELLVNRSDSLPHTLFLLDKTRVPRCGEYTAFDMPRDARFYRGARMIKHIRGCAGDRISVKDRAVFINDLPVGVAMTRSSNGRYALNPIEPSVIPRDKVYLSATHPQSYDSRYASFGLRDASELLGSARPLY
jgi:conjugal transfer pilin signal peptidase TrbI